MTAKELKEWLVDVSDDAFVFAFATELSAPNINDNICYNIDFRYDEKSKIVKVIAVD